MQSHREDRYKGAMFGLAAGDAVGTTLEFNDPGTFKPIADMVGGGPFGLKAGEFTDDTSMSLCLAASLVERRGFDAMDQMERYMRWFKDGYMSSNGKCFDIGNTVMDALDSFKASGESFCGSLDRYSAGNGSLMRLAPVPLAYAGEPAKAIEYAGLSSRTTHGVRPAVDACRYFAAMIVGAVNGATKDEILGSRYTPLAGYWAANPLCPEIDRIAQGSFKTSQPPAIKGTGYVPQSLEAALWAFHRSSSFEEGCLKAANLGDDADTTAAIYGQIAGAFYGLTGIPAQWISKLALSTTISDLASQLLVCAAGPLKTYIRHGKAAGMNQTMQALFAEDRTGVLKATHVAGRSHSLVAEASSLGLKYAVVMHVGPGDYTRPSGRAGIHSLECKPEWLHPGAAKFVFEYLQEQGWQPTIGQLPGSSSFPMVAHW